MSEFLNAEKQHVASHHAVSEEEIRMAVSYCQVLYPGCPIKISHRQPIQYFAMRILLPFLQRVFRSRRIGFQLVKLLEKVRAEMARRPLASNACISLRI